MLHVIEIRGVREMVSVGERIVVREEVFVGMIGVLWLIEVMTRMSGIMWRLVLVIEGFGLGV